MGYNTDYAKLRGPVYMGIRRKRTSDTDGDGITAQLGAAYHVGVCGDMSFSLTENREEIIEKISGNDTTDFTAPGTTGGTLNLSLYSWNRRILAMLLHGEVSVIRNGTLTAAPFLVRESADGPDGLFDPVGAALPNVQSTGLVSYKYYVQALEEDGILYPARNLNASTLVIKDSTSGTAKTLTEGTHYKVDPKRGRITFLNLTSGGPYVAPLKADVEFGKFKHQLGGNKIRPGFEYRLEYSNVSSVVVKDSAGSPATVNSSYYELDAANGGITFKRANFYSSGFAAQNYVMPLTVEGQVGTHSIISMLANQGWEYFVYAKLKNTVDGTTNLIDFYRCRASLPNNVDVLSTNTMVVPVQFDLMADLDMPKDSVLGQLGSIRQIPDSSIN